MTKALPLAVAITLAATLPGLAQSALERMETATEATSLNMEAFMVSRAPGLADFMPDWDWDDDMREAASCTIDAIRAEGGDEALNSYLDALDVFAETEFTSMEQLATSAPVPISSDFAVATSQSCGTDAIAMRRMEESGLMGAMMDPANMMALMGQ